MEQVTDSLNETPSDKSLRSDAPHLAAAQSSGEDRDRWVRNRDLDAAKMTADQIAEAQRLARAWDAAHPRDSPPSPLNRLNEWLDRADAMSGKG